MPGYQKGKIYEILNNIDDNVYVGSTCDVLLSQRMPRHRSMSKRNTKSLLYIHMNRLGVEHFYIELIELKIAPVKGKNSYQNEKAD